MTHNLFEFLARFSLYDIKIYYTNLKLVTVALHAMYSIMAHIAEAYSI